ncbi:DUF6612 family protein [Lentilactobacillus raoultii]|uniref:DUF6612 family protein n=1 Tax=Lentilactobacillus raoultii TaxID=1987503 RepID=A0ABW3PPF5_9LACO|nr:DUF6612 family protein [Lentilactobacillus raoultii]
MKKAMLFVLGVCLLALGGCANTSKVVSKSADAADSIKSGQAIITLKTTNSTGTQQTIDGGTFTLKPFVVALNQSNQSQPTSHYYINKNMLYIQMNKIWYKQKVDKNSQILSNTRNQMSAKSASQILKGIKKDLKLKTNDKTYTLSYDGDSKKATNTAKNILVEQSGKAGKQNADKIKVSHLTFKYTVNKKSYLPTKSHIKIQYTSKGESSTSTVDGSYADINKVKKVDIPQNIITSSKKFPAGLAKYMFK